jgi:hypothetical protein
MTMPEPTSSAAAVTVTAGGLTLFGVVTGLQPALLIAGLAGGWWALSYQRDAMTIGRRISVLGISALVAAWVTPPAVAMTVHSGWFPGVAAELMQYPGAAVVGLVAHAVIGPGLMRLAAKRAGEVAP